MDNKISKVELDEAVASINNHDKGMMESRYGIGQIIQGLVDQCGGSIYGQGVIESLSEHPDMRVSAQSLYNYWALYRLKMPDGEFWGSISELELNDSHLYGLGSLLSLKLPKLSKTQQQLVIKNELVKIAKIAHSRKQSAAYLRQHIVKMKAAIEEYYKDGYRDESEPSGSAVDIVADTTSEDPAQAAGETKDPKAQKRKLGDFLTQKPEGLVLLADWCKVFPKEALSTTQEDLAKMNKVVSPMADFYMTLVEHLVKNGEGDEVMPVIDRVEKRIRLIKKDLNLSSPAQTQNSNSLKIQGEG